MSIPWCGEGVGKSVGFVEKDQKAGAKAGEHVLSRRMVKNLTVYADRGHLCALECHKKGEKACRKRMQWSKYGGLLRIADRRTKPSKEPQLLGHWTTHRIVEAFDLTLHALLRGVFQVRNDIAINGISDRR